MGFNKKNTPNRNNSKVIKFDHLKSKVELFEKSLKDKERVNFMLEKNEK
jgi:hypothetical protein